MVSHPLAVSTYLARNVRRILPAFIMIAFIVVVVVAILSILRGLKHGATRYAREFRVFTVMLPKRNATITDAQKAAILAHPGVERVMDALNVYVRVKTLVAHLPYQVRGVYAEDLAFLVEKAGVRVVEGRLPQAGTNEIALHEWLMWANGWDVGQEFGVDVDENDWIPGRFKVVGVLSGDTPIGFASLEFLEDDARYGFAPKLWERLLVVPKDGRRAEVNAFLRTLPDLKTYDEVRALEEIDDSFDRIVLVTDVLSVVLILVVALVVGLLNNLFFAQRIDEFAVLLALGYRRGRLLAKVLGESHAIAVVAWALGAAVGLALLEAVSRLLFAPRGIFVPTVQAVPLLVSAAMPAVAMLFSGVTVVRRLGRLDPVMIIERRG